MNKIILLIIIGIVYSSDVISEKETICRGNGGTCSRNGDCCSNYCSTYLRQCVGSPNTKEQLPEDKAVCSHNGASCRNNRDCCSYYCLGVSNPKCVGGIENRTANIINIVKEELVGKIYNLDKTFYQEIQKINGELVKILQQEKSNEKPIEKSNKQCSNVGEPCRTARDCCSVVMWCSVYDRVCRR